MLTAVALSLCGAEAATARSTSFSSAGPALPLPACGLSCAGQDDVAVLERMAAGERHLRQHRLAAEAALDEIAHRVAGNLLLADRTLAQQLFDVAVVARARDDRAAAQVVHAAVADVRPVGLAALHQAHGAGRARAQVEGEPGAEGDDRVVRAAEREVQETERVEQGLGLLAEQFEHHLAAGLRGARAPGMTAHAVHDHEQRRALGGRDGGPVLVVLAIADQADLGEFDRHAAITRSADPAPC
jgi:hypothetical protein